MASTEGDDRTLTGKLVSSTGTRKFDQITVWFSYLPAGDPAAAGHGVRLETTSGPDGEFVFPLPAAPLQRAVVGAVVEGAATVDLEPDGAVLEPGDVIIMVDDFLPSHIRYAG